MGAMLFNCAKSLMAAATNANIAFTWEISLGRLRSIRWAAKPGKL